MTKEEFLDKKNAEYIRKLEYAFKNSDINENIFRWYWDLGIVNENVYNIRHFCRQLPDDYKGIRPISDIQAKFIILVDMIRTGDLIFKEKANAK